MSLRRVAARTIALWSKRRMDAELDEYIRSHLEQAEDAAIARGLSVEEARLEARREFGGISQMKEEHRDRRGFPFIETALRDFRYGLAAVRRTPGFATVVITVLALGIGGTVAMFSVLDTVLLKPLPFPDPDRIAALWEAPRPGTSNATTARQFREWQRLGTDFETLAAEQPVLAALNTKDGPQRIPGELVTPGYFKVFGVDAALGRTFSDRDSELSQARSVILSDSAWRTYFAADPGILQRQFILDGESCQVMGVLRPSAFDRNEAKFWKPLIFHPRDFSNPNHWLSVFGRLKQGITAQRAEQQMQAIYAALLNDRLMDEDSRASMVVRPLTSVLIGDNLQRSVVIAFGAISLVLLIASANVANLLFARGAARRVELAIRSALGAGRRRLIAQLLTECTVLCVFGGIAGIGVALLLIRAATPVLSDALPFTADVTLDLRALLFAAVVVICVALLTGMLPALQASYAPSADFMREGSHSASAVRLGLRRAIVIGEVALSLVLLTGALLLARSLEKLRQIDPGVRIENIITTSLSLPEQAYPTGPKAALFYETLAGRLSSLHGVDQVGLSTYLPLQWISNGEGLFIPGFDKPLPIRLKRVNPGYFHTFDMAVVRGRGIEESDRAGTPPVIVINQALATRLSELASINQPVGKLLRLTGAGYLGHESLVTNVAIAGVIRSERTASPGSPDPPVVYVSLAQMPSPHIKVVLRTREGTGIDISEIRHAVGDVDSSLPLGPLASMRQIRDSTLTEVSRPAGLLTAFASIAGLLSAVGLYGLVSYSVTQRRRELGIRTALGADRIHVIWQVVRSAMTMVGIGIAAGLAGVYALTRVLTSLLFEVSPLDPVALAVACLCMLGISALAAFFPALRAAKFDVVLSLKDA